MKNYKETTDSILKKREILLAQRKNRMRTFIKISSVSAGLLLIVLGIVLHCGIIRSKSIKDNKKEDYSQDSSLAQVSSVDEINQSIDDTLFRGNEDDLFINEIELYVSSSLKPLEDYEYNEISYAELMDYFDINFDINDVLTELHNTDCRTFVYKTDGTDITCGITKWEDEAEMKSVTVEIARNYLSPNAPFEIDTDKVWIQNEKILKNSRINNIDVVICHFSEGKTPVYCSAFFKDNIGYYLCSYGLGEKEVLDVIRYYLY